MVKRNTKVAFTPRGEHKINIRVECKFVDNGLLFTASRLRQVKISWDV